MSSFMVENKTINRIVDFVYWNTLPDKESVRREFEKHGIDFNKCEDVKINKELEKFGKMLIGLNALGVKSRYEDGFNADECLKDYNYFEIPLKDRQILQVLKSIHCLLYQCNEGKVAENPVFKSLEVLKNSIESHIINAIPEYNSAHWG